MIDIPESATVVDPDSDTNQYPKIEVRPAQQSTKSPQGSANATVSNNPFAFVDVAESGIHEKRKPETTTSGGLNHEWKILIAGLLLQGIVFTVFVITVGISIALMLPVIAESVALNSAPGSPPPAFNQSQSIPAIEIVLDGCSLLWIVSHILCCFSPPEVGVQHIARISVLVDILLPVLGFGLMLFPAVSDAAIMLRLAGAFAIWGLIQLCVSCWLLVGCADFSKNKPVFHQALFAHGLSVPVSFVSGFGVTILFSAGQISNWIGWVMIVTTALLCLAQFIILLLIICVSFQLVWILTRQAHSIAAE